ncbi:hypothetical protein J4465_00110 [Candidatus Pacearchaeota archaeon]|nr:hypothetical protein [Candidatus Pacearchaeota archaeon]
MENKLFFIGKKDKYIENIAKDKGYSKIFFIKEINSIDNLEYVESEKYNSCLINIGDIEKLRRAIDKAENKFEFIFILGLDDQINRIALENRKVAGLISPEFNRKFDYTHYRNSGLNHVLVKIAKENKKLIVQDLSFMQGTLDKKIRAQILGKILQNYKLARKYKLNELFILTFIAWSDKEIKKFADVKEFYEGFLTEIK